MSLFTLRGSTRPSLLLGLVLGFALLVPAGPTLVGAQTNPSPALDLRHEPVGPINGSPLPRWQRHLLETAHKGHVSTPSMTANRSVPLTAATPGDGTWAHLFPLGRLGHTAIYDPVRDRMIVFGGDEGYYPYVSNSVLALSLFGTPEWTELSPAGAPIPGLVFMSGIYDPVRDRMVIIGGNNGTTNSNDVWALTLSGTPMWTKLTTTQSEPVFGRAIYDPVRDRVLVVGYANQVWALPLSGAADWTRLQPTGTVPAARFGCTVIYDSLRDRLVLFGGENDDYPNPRDTWALSLSGTPAWTELAPAGTLPPGRTGHTAIYDPAHDRMVIFAGDNESYYSMNDTWALSFSGTPVWNELTPAGVSPLYRAAHSAIYDPVRERMVIFGGYYNTRRSDYSNEVWSLSLSGNPVWTPVPGPMPSQRSGHTAIYDSARDRMVVFGGDAKHYFPRDDHVWTLSLAGTSAWTEVIPAGTPPPLYGRYKAIHDPARDRMMVFGEGDVWSLSLSGTPAWTKLITEGTPGAVTIHDPVRDRMVGVSGTDVWSLSLSGTPTWTKQTTTGTPPSGRSGYSTIYDPVRDRLVIFGGYDAIFPYPSLNEVWALSLSGTLAWTKLTPAGAAPEGRSAHTAIYDPVRDRMVIFGGWDIFGDTWALSLSGSPAWTELSSPGPSPWMRESHTAIYDPVRDRMVVFGGGDFYVDYNDTWALEWGTPVDTTPPTITVELNRDVLWPPNHKMVEVCATVHVHDGVDPAPTFVLLSITSSEPDNDKGDGNTTGDIRGAAIGTPDLCYDLRAERQGGGSGREYRIIYRATDASNHVAYDTVSVRVPHDMSGKDAKPVMALSSVYPNPFNPQTTVAFSLAVNGRVQIVIYDVRGSLIRRLVDESMPEGEHLATWNGLDDAGRQASSGIYFVRMIAPSYSETRKIVMLK